MDNLPPQDMEAETSCIASVLLSKDALYKVTELLETEDFYFENHRVIYQAVLDLEKRNMPVDLVTLKQRLVDLNQFDKVGGDSALVDIYRTVSTSANVESYAGRVRELSLRRKIIDVSTGIIEKCYDRARETEVLVDEVERDIFNVTQKRMTTDFRDIGDVMLETITDIQKMREAHKPVTGIATGFNDLDLLLTGLHKSELIIIAARPSMGKTSLALNMANNIALRGNSTVLFFSLEMPATQLGMRLLCIESMIESQKVRTGKVDSDEIKKLMETSDKLSRSSIFIDDSPSINILQLRTKARRMAQKYKLGAIMVDYLQLISGPRGMERHLQIAEITRSLKQISRELEVPVIALSQLSRAVETRHDQRPQLSDLRESGAIEQDADVVLFIYREERVKPDTDRKGIADILVAKQRNGPIGDIELLFWDVHTKFGNLDKHYSGDDVNSIRGH